MNLPLIADDVIRHEIVTDRTIIPSAVEIIHTEVHGRKSELHIWYRVPEHFDEP